MYLSAGLVPYSGPHGCSLGVEFAIANIDGGQGTTERENWNGIRVKKCGIGSASATKTHTRTGEENNGYSKGQAHGQIGITRRRELDAKTLQHCDLGELHSQLVDQVFYYCLRVFQCPSPLWLCLFSHRFLRCMEMGQRVDCPFDDGGAWKGRSIGPLLFGSVDTLAINSSNAF